MGMQKGIQEFLGTNKVGTICYVKNSLPYCFNCLYAVIPGIEGMVFKSSKSSLHSQAMQNETPVAGTIYHTSKSGLNNSGVQFSGQVTMDHKIYELAEKVYYKCFPIALLIPGSLFIITFDTIKFSQTTNRGRRKMNWERAQNE
jgi:uncharacterized protein YhbP (UPF0306 family)